MYLSPKECNPFKENVSKADRASFCNDLKTYGQFTGLGFIFSPEPANSNNPPSYSPEGVKRE